MARIMLFILILLASCTTQPTNTPLTLYDEPSLKSFVLTTHDNNPSNTTALDSILQYAAADSAVLHQTITYLEKPFGDPNSGYRNEEMYGKLLQAKMNSRWYVAAERKSAEEKLTLLLQNQVGKPARDFEYAGVDGKKGRLYDLQADFVLLYFNNPDCDACKQMKETLMGSTEITEAVKSGKLKVLSVYPDRDTSFWVRHISDYPKQWIVARDVDEYLYRNKVYDLRAIPTLYLLDKEKKVLLKDCLDVAEIEAQLNMH